MKPIKLRIAQDGTVRGLWHDRIDWRNIGRLRITQASHVEFDDKTQQWTVQTGQPRGLIRRWLQRLTGRPFGEILHGAPTRTAALEWERRYFQDNLPTE
jgi:hypothetical protein